MVETDHVPARHVEKGPSVSFREFPPRQDPAAFNLDSVMKSVADASGSGLR